MACDGIGEVEVYPIPNPYPVKVTGDNYEWRIQYPGKDGQLDTDDDIEVKQNMHLPTQIPVKLFLHSRDYLYFIDLPEFGQIGLAVPDMTHTLDFSTTEAGTFAIRGDQMCGYSHESLFGKLVVEKPRRFFRWLSKNE